MDRGEGAARRARARNLAGAERPAAAAASTASSPAMTDDGELHRAIADELLRVLQRRAVAKNDPDALLERLAAPSSAGVPAPAVDLDPVDDDVE